MNARGPLFKWPRLSNAVIPAKAGIQLLAISIEAKLDPRFRGDDECL